MLDQLLGPGQRRGPRRRGPQLRPDEGRPRGVHREQADPAADRLRHQGDLQGSPAARSAASSARTTTPCRAAPRTAATTPTSSSPTTGQRGRHPEDLDHQGPRADQPDDVAVVLDQLVAGGVNDAEVTKLVTSAAGLDPKRGDIVTVSKLAFDTQAAAEAKKELDAAAADKQRADMFDMAKTGGLIVLIALALFIGVRRSRKEERTPVDLGELPVYRDEPAELESAPLAMAVTSASTAPVLPAAPANALAESNLQARNEIGQLIEQQPDEVAAAAARLARGPEAVTMTVTIDEMSGVRKAAVLLVQIGKEHGGAGAEVAAGVRDRGRSPPRSRGWRRSSPTRAGAVLVEFQRPGRRAPLLRPGRSRVRRGGPGGHPRAGQGAVEVLDRLKAVLVAACRSSSCAGSTRRRCCPSCRTSTRRRSRSSSRTWTRSRPRRVLSGLDRAGPGRHRPPARGHGAHVTRRRQAGGVLPAATALDRAPAQRVSRPWAACSRWWTSSTTATATPSG